MGIPRIQLSIALVTRNRPTSLERTLKSLRCQSVQPFEVIISDDSDDAHRSATSALAKKYDCIYQPGPQRGLYANRNSVARACRGTHFRTMDDDHEFPSGHIEACINAIRNDPAAIWIIGEIHSTEVEEGIGRIPCPGELHPRGYSKPPINPEHCRAISCGATVYPRSVVDLNILNVEYFKFGITYLEYGCRLARLGYRIRHLQNTYVIHHSDLNDNVYRVDETALAARTFAMLCIASMYERSFGNTLQVVAEIVRTGLVHPIRLSKALWPAIRAFKLHRSVWKQQLAKQILV